jgi:hypothetical protein
MKKTIKITGILTTIMAFSHVGLYADADEAFVQRNSTVNSSFIRSIARNRSFVGDQDVVFVEIDGKDDFKEKLESGELTQNVQQSSGITTQYVYKDIKNVNITDRDLSNVKGETLNLGSHISGNNQEVVQVLNIKNTNIKTDKHINAGVTSDSSSLSGITSVTTIENSDLLGDFVNND